MAAVGFGPSPNSTSPHQRIELEVPLVVVYSPDTPLFWSGTSTVRGGQTGGGGGLLCEKPLVICDHPDQPCPVLGVKCCCPITASSSVVLTSSTTGRTSVAPLPLTPVSSDDLCKKPSGDGILGSLVDAAVPKTGSYRNHGDYTNQVSHFVEKLLEDLAANGIIQSSQIPELQSCLVSPRARSNVGK